MTARIRPAVSGQDHGLPHLAKHVAASYGLGDVHDWAVLTTGYEDTNIDLRTAQARVVVKAFSPARAGIAARTAGIVTAALASGVRHPRLRRDDEGRLVHPYAGHQLIVMDFDPGRSLYDLRRPPDDAELRDIIDQAVRVHAVPVSPEPVFDLWGITNIGPMYAAAGRYLEPRLRRLVDRAVTETSRTDRAALPSALIHADLTKGNVLISPAGQATIIDFAVAARLPRVQELAVIAANLTHGSPQPVPARSETIAALYSAAAPVPLDTAELDALRAFTLAATAMELLGALSEWHSGNHSAETEYLIGLGTAGLRDYLTGG